jgi:hypothetical protein
MKCSVCENDIGFWAKLTARSRTGVCKSCHEEGSRQLQDLVQSIGAANSFGIPYADRWVTQFEELIRRYRMPESEASPLRFALLNNMFKLVEAEEEMTEGDLKFLLALSHKYDIGKTSTPELRDTIFRVGAKEIIQSWEHGEVPHKECSGLVLQKSELCNWEEGAALRVQKTKREYVGSYSSMSVPVPLVRGARFRVGGFKGHPIDHTVLEDGGVGVLHITNQRVCFTGQQQSVAIPYKKMISVGGFEGGFIIRTSNEKKPGIFIVRHPELTAQMLALASNPPETNDPPRKRREKLPSAV